MMFPFHNQKCILEMRQSNLQDYKKTIQFSSFNKTRNEVGQTNVI